MNNKIVSILGLGLLAFAGCKPNLKGIDVSKGTADFTTYVAMGNSLCAGYTDGGLTKESQANSFPRMLAQQFALAGGGEFKTPYMDAAGNGNDGTGKPIYKLVMVNGAPAPAQIGTATTLDDDISGGGLYNHLGIPGIRAVDGDVPYYGNFNKFLGRIVSNKNTTSLLSLAMAKKPTFFTYWLGANDVLGWATGGGIGAIQTAPAAAFPGTLMHPLAVSISIAAQIDSLTKNGAKGAIANIPDVASTPYFTTVPYNAVNLTSQAVVDQLNAGYAAFNSMVPAPYKIVWQMGANPIVIADSLAPGFIRKARPSDLICLTAASFLQAGSGSVTALADAYVLDSAEVALARSYTNQYNAAIKSIADAKGLAFVDANSYLKTFQSGVKYNGVDLSPVFVTGGGFGLDGVHPTPRGYALIANQFILAINDKYASTLPQVNVNAYRGVLLP
jgi:GDSL-like Lipase/Acylhydrolase